MGFWQWVSDYSWQLITLVALVHAVSFVGVIWRRKATVNKLGGALKEISDKSGFGTTIMADLTDDDLIDSCLH